MQTPSPKSRELRNRALAINKELLLLAKEELKTTQIYFPLRRSHPPTPPKFSSPQDRAFLDIDNLPAKMPKRRKATDLTEYTEKRTILGNVL